MNRRESLISAVDFHDAAADSFAAAAAAIPPARWSEPLASGKWSPAQLAAHLTATYDILISELRGGPGMAIRTNFPQRILLRLIFLPRILYRGTFPRGARAPRETRPPETSVDQWTAVALFRQRASEFAAAARGAAPGAKLTHAYFGKASIASGVRLCAHHIEHHRAQLP